MQKSCIHYIRKYLTRVIIISLANVTPNAYVGMGAEYFAATALKQTMDAWFNLGFSIWLDSLHNHR